MSDTKINFCLLSVLPLFVSFEVTEVLLLRICDFRFFWYKAPLQWNEFSSADRQSKYFQLHQQAERIGHSTLPVAPELCSRRALTPRLMLRSSLTSLQLVPVAGSRDLDEIATL